VRRREGRKKQKREHAASDNIESTYIYTRDRERENCKHFVAVHERFFLFRQA
jgi:hypothetical protein